MGFKSKSKDSGDFSMGLALDVETILRYRSKNITLHHKQQKILDDYYAEKTEPEQPWYAA